MPRNPAPTYAEIAADYALWGKYFDVDGLDSPEQWEALGQAARVQMLREAFGPPTICDQCGRNSHDERGDGACGHCA